MDMRQELTEYIKNITNGVVTIKPNQAEQIIKFCSQGSNPTGMAKFYRYDLNKSGWELKRTMYVSDSRLKEVTAGSTKPAEQYFTYRFDLILSTGECIASIYTVQTNLFD